MISLKNISHGLLFSPLRRVDRPEQSIIIIKIFGNYKNRNFWARIGSLHCGRVCPSRVFDDGAVKIKTNLRASCLWMSGCKLQFLWKTTINSSSSLPLSLQLNLGSQNSLLNFKLQNYFTKSKYC